MFDTDIIDGERVAYIEPKSLVHEILAFIASQKIMAILGSNSNSEFGTRHSARIENDPSFVLTTEIFNEFNLDLKGFKWLYSTHILAEELTSLQVTSNGQFRHDNYITMTNYGEQVLGWLENGEEVKLYLD